MKRRMRTPAEVIDLGRELNGYTDREGVAAEEERRDDEPTIDRRRYW